MRTAAKHFALGVSRAVPLPARTRIRSLVALVFAVAVVATSSAFAFGSAASALPAPPAQPPGLDHFLCYNATVAAGATFPVLPSTLVNQLNPATNAISVTQTSGQVDLHCNPASKTVKSSKGVVTNYPAKSPSWHLLCFKLDTGLSTTYEVKVSDQFGAAKLTLGPPGNFCLPSLKTLVTNPTGEPEFNPPGPNEIMPDHFTCYPVAPESANPFTMIPPVVKVKDQFTGKKILLQVGLPDRLCVPTQKTLEPNGPTTPITNATAHLLCFSVTPATTFPTPPQVFDENQFNQQPFNPSAPGPGFTPVQIGSVNSLCLPSYKKLISTGTGTS